MSHVTLSVMFALPVEDQLHLFAQYMEKAPSTDLSKMSKAKFHAALREVLYDRGSAALSTTLPTAIELKKFDYRAQLKGVVNFT